MKETIKKCIDKIQEAWNKLMYKLMFKKLIWIEIKTDKFLHMNDFRVFSKKRKKDVTNEVQTCLFILIMDKLPSLNWNMICMH